ncbi:hypothetical protein FBU30_008937 [Linnemannia zychae]|nr:hypothetical protein FBU30_008937 [Linnemannia zychae]
MTLPQLRHEDRLSVEHSPTESGWEFNQEPWLQREEPYLHSPSLQKLKLPLIKYPEVAQGISKALENHCSNLTDLTIPSVAISQEMFSDILKAIPEQRLKKLCAIKASDTPIRPLSATVFPRHSESLRCIKLHDCKWLPSKTLQAILISCKSLEVLIIKNDLSTLETTLELEDAVESIWACTEINELDIPITITPDGRNPKYFDDPTMKSWTEENYNHWKMLDMFYTQIGSLKELRRLYLRAAGMSDIDGISSNIYYKNVCLPGLLALEDSDIPKIGFLSKLEGLVRLQEFGGSVSWQTEEALATIGEPEINWFVQHLPGLKQACFIKDIILEYEPLPVGDNVPETVREVNRRRPGLALGPSFDELFEYV